MAKRALLALENGALFFGDSIGADATAVGEVVFNTAITGYQEILTDPSYCRQLITLTHPHIGNVGTNDEDNESSPRVHAAGLIVRDVPARMSNWRGERPLGDFLEGHGLPGIAGIDTRRLTRILRDQGAQSGCLTTEASDPDRAVEQARAFAGLAGMDLAREVTAEAAYDWDEGTWKMVPGELPPVQYRVVAYDYGIKQNILRLLRERGCAVTVVPATTPASEVLAQSPDGVFLSNGPGDPEPCAYAQEAIQELLEAKIPMFGICLGCQLLGLASGARTVKMKTGHHGANHPVLELDTGRVLISSQNHGFAVDEESLPDHLRLTHRSLFDGTVQGISHTEAPAFAFQGHPEASPGPHDVASLFDHFTDLMQQHRAGQSG